MTRAGSGGVSPVFSERPNHATRRRDAGAPEERVSPPPGKVVRSQLGERGASCAFSAGQDARLYGRPEARRYG
jgi:hypothetical protein